jgi:hypothetical protein
MTVYSRRAAWLIWPTAMNGWGVALHQDRLLAAALFQLLAAFTSAAIAVTLYPVLRQHAAGMALGAVALGEGTG